MARRTFAASVVVTVSLFEPACTSSGTATPTPPPPEEEKLHTRNPPEPPPEIPARHESGDGPTTAAEGGEPPRQTEIVRRDDGTCVEQAVCPEGAECKPSLATVVPCPDDGSLPKASVFANVRRQDDGSCWEHVTVDCPEGVMCNPPPPRQVQCPSEDHLPTASNPERVFQRPDGTCWESFDVKCPPNVACNPPRPRQVKCSPQ